VKVKKEKQNGGNADEQLYAVYDDVHAALPYHMRANYTKSHLQRQCYNRALYLPYYRARTHHVEPCWRVADLVRWFSNFPVPTSDFDAFMRELRQRASTSMPSKPTRASAAGLYGRVRVAR
jgi:hypothetical protein